MSMRLLYCTSCNKTPLTSQMFLYQHIRTDNIHTNTLAFAVNTLLPKQEVKMKQWQPRDRPAGRGWRKLRGHDSLAGQTKGRKSRARKGSSREQRRKSQHRITQPSPGPRWCKHTPYTPARATPVILLIKPKARSTLLRSAQV